MMIGSLRFMALGVTMHAKAPLKIVASICCLAGLLACARAAPPPPEEQKAGKRIPYVIGIPDVLRVSVWKNPELSVDVPVRNDGKISVPLLDDIQAEGLTPGELKEVITEQLSEFITAPDVTVIVLQANSHMVTVVGEVARSGTVPLTREMRVLDAVATVGGFTTWSNKNDIRILRPTSEKIVSYRFNYGAYVAGKAPDSNLLLEPGDTIVVPD